jgi:hypothetical protein
MVSTKRKILNKINTSTLKGGADKKNIALGIGTLGIAPLAVKARGKISGEASHFGSADYKNTEQVLKDLSTIKKGKTLELMRVWASEDSKKWLTSYRWAEKIFNGFKKFIEDIINKKIVPPNSDIQIEFLKKEKRSKLLRIILGLIFMLFQQANMSRIEIINFLKEVKTLEIAAQPKKSTTGANGKTLPESPGLSKTELRKQILQKVIDLVNKRIQEVNKIRLEEFKPKTMEDIEKVKVHVISQDAREERIIQMIFIEIKRALILNAKEEKEYLEQEMSLEQNINKYQAQLSKVQVSRVNITNEVNSIALFKSNIDKLENLVLKITSNDFKNKLIETGQDQNEILNGLINRATSYVSYKNNDEKIKALTVSQIKDHNKLMDVLIKQLTEIFDQITNAFLKKQKSEKTFTVSDVQSFGIPTDNLLYRRFSIERHLTPVNESSDLPLDENVFDTATVWLKVLVIGKVPLAEYTNNDRNYFYYIKNNRANELIYSKGIKMILCL